MVLNYFKNKTQRISEFLSNYFKHDTHKMSSRFFLTTSKTKHK